jgi:hypothetical protein
MFLLPNSFIASLRTKHCYWRADTSLAGGSHRMRACMGLYAVPTIVHYAGSPVRDLHWKKKTIWLNNRPPILLVLSLLLMLNSSPMVWLLWSSSGPIKHYWRISSCNHFEYSLTNGLCVTIRKISRYTDQKNVSIFMNFSVFWSIDCKCWEIPFQQA